MGEYTYIEAEVKKIQALPGFHALEARPCSEEEIHQLQAGLPEGAQLPEAFLEFLRFCGKGLSNWGWGGEYFASLLANVKSDRIQKVLQGAERERDEGDLPFLFAEVQGSSYVFFSLNDGPDPKVFIFDGVEAPQSYHASYSSWFRSSVSSFCQNYESGFAKLSEQGQRILDWQKEMLGLREELQYLNERGEGQNEVLVAKIEELIFKKYRLFEPQKKDFLDFELYWNARTYKRYNTDPVMIGDFLARIRRINDLLKEMPFGV